MAGVLDELGLSRLADIPALTAVGAAAILAEAGDPHRYDSSSSLVKHAGMSPSDNASGTFLGDAHISRHGRPGLRLTVWRAVWPMLQFNPVMAAKYQAMTQAADDRRRASRAGTGRPARPPRRPGAARQGPRRVRCLAAALDLLHGRPRHQLGCRGRRRRGRRPARPPLPGGGGLTSAILPAPSTSALRPSSLTGGERARPGVGDHPVRHPGQLSPGRLELLTSPVEHCRSTPARPGRGPGRARLHYVEREDPGDGRPDRTARPPSRRCGTSACPRPPRRPACPRPPASSVARTPRSRPSTRATEISSVPLDKLPLTLVSP